MKTTDINRFKGQVKDAILAWAGAQIDQMLPNRVAARVMLKNAAGNLIARFDAKIDAGIDALFLMLGDKDGKIDTDTVVDTLCNLLNEMPPTDYALGPIGAKVGNGEIVAQIPGGLFSDMVLGNFGGVRVTTSDIQEFKNLFK